MTLTDALLLAILVVIVGPPALDMAGSLLNAVLSELVNGLERLSMTNSRLGRIAWRALPWRCAFNGYTCEGPRLHYSHTCYRHAEEPQEPVPNGYGSHNVIDWRCTHCGMPQDILDRAIRGILGKRHIGNELIAQQEKQPGGMAINQEAIDTVFKRLHRQPYNCWGKEDDDE